MRSPLFCCHLTSRSYCDPILISLRAYPAAGRRYSTRLRASNPLLLASSNSQGVTLVFFSSLFLPFRTHHRLTTYVTPRITSCTATLWTSMRNTAISYGLSLGAKGQSCQFGSTPKGEWAFAHFPQLALPPPLSISLEHGH